MSWDSCVTSADMGCVMGCAVFIGLAVVGGIGLFAEAIGLLNFSILLVVLLVIAYAGLCAHYRKEAREYEEREAKWRQEHPEEYAAVLERNRQLREAREARERENAEKHKER